MCAVHDDDVDGELSSKFVISKSILQAGDAEGVDRDKGADCEVRSEGSPKAKAARHVNADQKARLFAAEQITILTNW